jgi:hypothetical protein
MTNNQNGSRPWTVTEIDAKRIPPPLNERGHYFPLFEEMVKRLEQTLASKALRFDLGPVDKRGVGAALGRYINRRRGRGTIIISVRTEGDTTVLYAQRGPNWNKS